MSQATEQEAPPHPWAGQELEHLRDLLDEGRVKLGVHIRKMNSPGSPVYRYGENVIPAAIILTTSFGATALIHFYVGAVVLAIGCTWWVWKVQPRIKDGVFERSAAWVLEKPIQFDLMWAKGVLSLYAQLPDGRERVATRRDDWRAYVRSFHDDPGLAGTPAAPDPAP